MSQNEHPPHAALFKHAGSTVDEMRKQREMEDVVLRKAKREEQVSKRRNLNMADEGDPGSLCGPKVDAELLTAVAVALGSPDAAAVADAVSLVRKLLSREPDAPIEAVIEAGLVPSLVSIVASPSVPATVRFDAAWALTNVASGDAGQTAAVVEAGAVPVFVSLIGEDGGASEGGSQTLLEQAVWALGNIAGDSPTQRDFVLGQGVVRPLCSLLATSTQLSLIRNVVWVLSNLCRGKKPSADLEMLRPALPLLGRCLSHPDTEVVRDATWALSYVSDGDNARIQAVVELEVCERLRELLHNPCAGIVSAALRTLGNVVSGDDAQTQAVLDASVLPALGSLLSQAPKESIRKEACWAISNVTAGSRKQIQAVISAGLVPPLIAVLEKADFAIRKEAAWALSNLISGGSPAQLAVPIEGGVVPQFCDLLTVTDPALVLVCLSGLDGLLATASSDAHNAVAASVEECGGLDKLEFLQSHDNEAIYVKAFEIIEKYFCDEVMEDVNENLAPSVAADGSGFFFNPDGAGDPFNPSLASSGPEPSLPPS